MKFSNKLTLELDSRFTWILCSRLLVFILILGVSLFFISYSDFLKVLFLVYSILTFILLFLIFFSSHSSENSLKLVFSLQLILEIFVEAVLVYTSGVIKTPLSILFFLSIVSASLNYQLIGTLLVATWASLSYTLVILYSLGWEISNLFSYQALKGVYQL